MKRPSEDPDTSGSRSFVGALRRPELVALDFEDVNDHPRASL
jgi:hypothetical protein